MTDRFTGAEALVDVLIVGAGAAGITAALEVEAAGGSWRLLDALPDFGGTAITSGGGCCLAATALQAERGIHDTPDLATADLVAAGEGEADEAWARFYFEHSPEQYAWLVDQGVEFRDVRINEHSSVARWHAPTGAGKGLIEALWSSLGPPLAGERWLPGTTVEDLLIEDGRVVGVVARTADGVGPARTYRAKTVVMATGGFSANHELLLAWVPALRAAERLLCGGGVGAQGLGHRLLHGYGAQLTGLGNVWTYVHAIADGRDPTGQRGLAVRGSEAGIWVNQAGVRFHDENRNGPTTALPALLAQPGATCWAILDAVTSRGLRIADPAFRGRTPDEKGGPVQALAAISDAVTQAPDLSELAAATGIDPGGLEATVAAWNDQLRSGTPTDPLTGRELTGLAPLEIPPFVALRFHPMARKNLGGVRTDLCCRVLDAAGAPIPGLYAAGELAGMAGGHLSGRQALEGIMIGGSLFSGRVAGAWAAHAAGHRFPQALDAGVAAAVA